MKDERAFAVQQQLVERGVVAPLSVDPDEVQRWLSWDLASLIEGHFHQVVDTHALPESQRAEWIRRATERGLGFRDPHKSYMLPCWLLSGDDRVGTFGIHSFLFETVGGAAACLASLYVRPDHRRQGIATRAIDTTYDATLQAGGDGLRIPTSWCWQDTVRFYTQRGLWCRTGAFGVRPATLWPYQWNRRDHGAVSVLVTDVDSTARGEERRRGAPLDGSLGMRQCGSPWCMHAPGTFAVLALAGWPSFNRRNWDDV